MISIRMVVVLILFSICMLAYGDDKGPESLAEKYFNTLQTDGVTSVGQFLHPDALAEFKNMMLPIIEAEANSGQHQLKDVLFGDSATVAEIKEMDHMDFMNSCMNLIAIQMGSANISFDKMEILGTIEEGDARHVVTRIAIGADELAITQFEVLSFMPYEDTWRLQLSGKMKGLAATLRANMPKN
ncbi:MAG: hypothetical protein GY865_19425 [candidate division Zixibacteria bacterium]|nr:hypothetical protein [candidate division Zixibacteria bacterium]